MEEGTRERSGLGCEEAGVEAAAQPRGVDEPGAVAAGDAAGTASAALPFFPLAIFTGCVSGCKASVGTLCLKLRCVVAADDDDVS
jgi:hypothetical protein